MVKIFPHFTVSPISSCMAVISIVPSVDPVSSPLPGVFSSLYSTEVFSVVWQWDDIVQLFKKKRHHMGNYKSPQSDRNQWNK